MSSSPELSFSTRRPTRRRWVRVVVVVALLAALTALVGGLLLGSLWAYAWVRLGPESVPSLTADDGALGADGATAPEGVTTALVALVEEQDETLPDEPALTGPVALIQAGGPRGDDAAVLLLPADLPVTVDGSDAGTLTEAHDEAGLAGLLQAAVDHTGVRVDHVVRADRGALPRLAELLGDGVEVCAPDCGPLEVGDVEASLARLGDAAPGDAGPVVGELAVMLRELAASVDARGALTSPLATKRAIDVLAEGVRTDVPMRGAAALTLADRLAEVDQVAVASLPGVVNPDDGRLVILPEQAEVRYALLRDGGVPEDTTDDPSDAVLAEARVAVQNGTGTAGYAAELEGRLTAAGVQVVGTENALTFDEDTTTIRYGADDPIGEATAVLLADVLGGGVVLEASDRPLSFEGDRVDAVVVGGADLDDGEA